MKKIQKEKTIKALEKVGMLEYKDRQISQLSGGQQQRVFIARALVMNADVYLLDEPFQGIDKKTEEAMAELLRGLCLEGKTVLAVHHDLATVEKYFSHVTLLNLKVIASGEVDKVYTEENIEKTYA